MHLLLQPLPGVTDGEGMFLALSWKFPVLCIMNSSRSYFRPFITMPPDPFRCTSSAPRVCVTSSVKLCQDHPLNSSCARPTHLMQIMRILGENPQHTNVHLSLLQTLLCPHYVHSPIVIQNTVSFLVYLASLYTI